MPRPKSLQPAYCLHRRSGRAYVTIDGKQITLPGPHGSVESRAEYNRLVAAYLSRTVEVVATPAPQPAATAVTVAIVARDFWRHAQSRYVDAQGNPTGEAENYRVVLRELNRMFGDLSAAEFGPKRLKELRTYLLRDRTELEPESGRAIVRKGWCRNVVNRAVKRIQAVFRWATSEELIDASIPAKLDTVTGLRIGESNARETGKVRPVSEELVDATLPFLPPPVAGIVKLMRLCGARAGELAELRTCDIERSGAVWKAALSHHKTLHHGAERVLYFGPQAQAVLQEFFRPELQAHLFQPADAIAWRNAEARKRREEREGGKVKLTPTQIAKAAASRRRKPKHPINDHYDVHAINHCIGRACRRAFPEPAALTEGMGETQAVEALRKWRADHHWHLHRLRHTAATTFRREADFEAAKILLGHSTDSMTQKYAERDARLAEAAIARIG